MTDRLSTPAPSAVPSGLPRAGRALAGRFRGGQADLPATEIWEVADTLVVRPDPVPVAV